MRFLVDTNIIISALVKDGLTRHLLTHLKDELISIKITEVELGKYKKVIQKKSGLSQTELDILLNNLFEHIIFIEDHLVRSKMKKAKEIMDNIDADDTPFIAAALATKSIIWSDDKHFQKQNSVKVLTTKEVQEYFKLE